MSVFSTVWWSRWQSWPSGMFELWRCSWTKDKEVFHFMLLAQIQACLWSMSQPRNVTTGINTNIFFNNLPGHPTILLPNVESCSFGYPQRVPVSDTFISNHQANPQSVAESQPMAFEKRKKQNNFNQLVLLHLYAYCRAWNMHRLCNHTVEKPGLTQYCTIIPISTCYKIALTLVSRWAWTCRSIPASIFADTGK